VGEGGRGRWKSVVFLEEGRSGDWKSRGKRGFLIEKILPKLA